MSIISWIIFGAIAGWIAGRLYGDGRPEGCVTNTVVGIGGALLGGAIYTLITGRDFTTGFNLTSLIVAIFGSLLLIFVLQRISRSSR
ncbi:MAG: GlsB/YeaQ/YmgE family stress response membrane protein [Chloroflexota bacterium]|nr:GlsB/YeaQ/YmgE family stress response membrane protein [Chloroflexota bacterium]